jgi:hypothetical protein
MICPTPTIPGLRSRAKWPLAPARVPQTLGWDGRLAQVLRLAQVELHVEQRLAQQGLLAS